MTDSDYSPKLKNLLCHRLYTASNAITRTYRSFLENINLTYPQYITMIALWEKDNLSVKELHQITEIDNGCLSLMLKKMVEKKLITLVPCNKDKRIKYVQLTKMGRQLEAIAMAEKNKIEQTRTKRLTEEEYNQLVDLLDKLKNNLLQK